MYVTKSILRSRFIKKRKKLHNEKKHFSLKKVYFLIKKNFPKKNISIAGYYPSNCEVNILNSLLQAEQKRFKIGLPIVKDSQQMIFKYWLPSEPLYVNKYGILEPNKKNMSFIPDVVLVPLAVFDKNMNRIGYGKGYYDRALRQISIKKKILTIGIAFSFQQTSNIPVNKYDYNLDCILTDKKLIYKKNNENFIFR